MQSSSSSRSTYNDGISLARATTATIQQCVCEIAVLAVRCIMHAGIGINNNSQLQHVGNHNSQQLHSGIDNSSSIRVTIAAVST